MKEKEIGILIIEDSETYRELLTFILNRLSIPANKIVISTAQSLQISKDILSTAAFNVIILDLRLPDSSDGYATFAAIQDLVMDVPIVVLSGEYTTRNNYIRKQFIALGAFEYLNKIEVGTENRLLNTVEAAIWYGNSKRQSPNVSLTEIKEVKKDFDRTLDTINKYIPEIK